jgi:hypothetical protein
MKTQSNPNAPRPSAARFAVRPDGLARRGLCCAPLVVALFLMVSTLASARTETLRWTHNDPSNVAGFTIYFGPSSANYTTVIDVPPLQSDAQGIFTFDIGVPDDATIYVAVTAYDDDDLESGYSNEKTRSPATSEPDPEPDPADPPEPDPALGKPGTPYVVEGPPTGEETLTVSVSTSGSGPTVSSRVTNAVGPYQFLFDCGLDGHWNGITNTSQPAASYTCGAGTSTIKVWVWDQGTGATLEEVVAVGN